MAGFKDPSAMRGSQKYGRLHRHLTFKNGRLHRHLTLSGSCFVKSGTSFKL
jgi:hypothetical protein